MSLKTNPEILGEFSHWPKNLTFGNFRTILTDPAWYMGYVNSIFHVVMNTVISIAAAYAFSRYRFMGDKHLFFWLLTNRMAPPAVFALPFVQLYSSISLFDTHIAVALAHCLFNVPLAVCILEGIMRGVPKEIDETSYIDGDSFPQFFLKIFMPLISSGIKFTTGPDGKLYQLPDQQFANLYGFRYDGFNAERTNADFKAKYGHDPGLPLNWLVHQDIAEFFTGRDMSYAGGPGKVYGNMDYGK